jgi:1,4-alpha-glucan branching enzyme
VALVGDFNGWDEAATPMRHDANNTWSVTVPLAAGWHAYAFVLDGAQWIHDPRAPLAPADEFGGPRSVVVVGEHGDGV